jgi:aspartokinase/homoserine dehydrogenase 1
MSIVLKFGGTSLENTQRMVEAAQRIQHYAHQEQVIVVASAMGGVTRLLRQLTGLLPLQHDPDAILSLIRQQHWNVLGDLGGLVSDTHSELQELFNQLEVHLQEPQRQGHPNAWTDHLLGFGERASVRLLSFILNKWGQTARYYESDQFIKTDQRHGAARILDDESAALVREYLGHSCDHIPVVTGFIGETLDQRPTTLGRSGSDYTASWLAAQLQSDVLEIWTDVDGIQTADPSRIVGTRPIPQLTYAQLHRLTEGGSSVIHPAILDPLRSNPPELHIRNSFNPDHPGTIVRETATAESDSPQTNFSVARHPVSILRWTSPHRNLPRTLVNRQLVLHHQVSKNPSDDQYHHCLVCKDAPELEHTSNSATLSSLVVEPATAIRVIRLNGLWSSDRKLRIHQLLEQYHPISATTDDSLLYIVSNDYADAVEQQLHDLLRLGKVPQPLVLIGLGNVGQELIAQLADHPQAAAFRLIGVCDSKHLWLDRKGIPLEQATKAHLKKQATYSNTQELHAAILRNAPNEAILIDCSGDSTIADGYPQLIQAGFHILTPSKHAGSADLDYYQQLQSALTKNQRFFRDETTVGAGLPVLQTIDRLRYSGDQIERIACIASGSLNFILTQLDNGVRLSQAVQKAQKLGYTEPDPSEDLSGTDVVRKARILARRSGWEIPKSEIQLTPLISPLNSADTLHQILSELDDQWIARIRKAHAQDMVLRYVATIDENGIEIGLRSVPNTHELAQTRNTQNAFIIHSEFYSEQPLIIKGPGAGVAVTANGLMQELVQLEQRLQGSQSEFTATTQL